MAERFVTFDIREVEKFIDNEENSNTRKKTKNDMALLSSFMAKEKENRQVEEIPPQELDNYLSRFLLSVRKKNGDEYEPSTLRGFIASIERYLKKCRYSESVITGQNFARTRDALKSKQKHLKRLGKGNKPNEASSLTPEERDILFERKEMGFSSPKALINTLWLNNCMHFGLCGGKEQRELKWGDVVLKTNPFGKEYLEYCTERQTKTRPGDNPSNVRKVKPKMYEQPSLPPERNPVFVYKFYKAKRPNETLVEDAPFYLAVNHVSSEQLAFPDTKWFKPQPMGVNKLNSLMKECAAAAGIGENKRITNHSGRKTLTQTLLNHDVPPTQIIQVTGHKNLQSVNNYGAMGERQQENVSSILSATSTTSAAQPLVPRQVGEFSTASSSTATCMNTTSGTPNQLSSLFLGNHITGGTFNVHVSTTSSLASSTLIAESPKRKKYRRLRVLDSDSSQSGNSQE